jgi:hypothetical protein
LPDLQRIIEEETGIPGSTVSVGIDKLMGKASAHWRHGVQWLNERVNPIESPEWRWVPIGQYLMWATFTNGSDDPFDGLDDEQILPALGIPPDPIIPYLKLIYTLPREIISQYPTVIEVAASQPWDPYFIPAGEREDHGWTRPVPGHNVRRRPEVVHQPVYIEQLIDPIRIIHTGWFLGILGGRS